MKDYRLKKIMPAILALILLITIIIFSTGCVCPLFSWLERFTGLKISAGNNIDTGLVADELIYPGSVALVQVSGEIERVLELIGEYGIALSEDELEVLNQLPEQIKEQDISTTAYSTADDRNKVLGYYNSLTLKGWIINDFGGAGGGLQGSSMFLAEKEERKQALLLTETGSNTFIVFVNFDWDVLEEMEE